MTYSDRESVFFDLRSSGVEPTVSHVLRVRKHQGSLSDPVNEQGEKLGFVQIPITGRFHDLVAFVLQEIDQAAMRKGAEGHPEALVDTGLMLSKRCENLLVGDMCRVQLVPPIDTQSRI